MFYLFCHWEILLGPNLVPTFNSKHINTFCKKVFSQKKLGQQKMQHEPFYLPLSLSTRHMIFEKSLKSFSQSIFLGFSHKLVPNKKDDMVWYSGLLSDFKPLSLLIIVRTSFTNRKSNPFHRFLNGLTQPVYSVFQLYTFHP